MTGTDLAQVKPGESVSVSEVGGTEPVMMRLLEIGLIPGRVVTVLRRAPFGGPIELLVDQTRVAVRATEAARVQVVAEPAESPEVVAATAESSADTALNCVSTA